jgi:hypothetical protein
MVTTSKLEQAFALMREAVAEAYHRGEQDAIERLVALARGQSVTTVDAPPQTPNGKAARTPRGAPEAFVRRVLASEPHGLTLDEIVGRAVTPEERTISQPAVRVCLWRAEKKGWADNIVGKWFLTGKEEKN